MRRGFSLIEIIVVIAIIAVIAGVGFVAARAMMGQAAIETSRALVHSTAGLITEYQAKTDRLPDVTATYGNDADPGNAARFADSIEELLLAVKGGVGGMIQGIDGDFRGNLDGDFVTPATVPPTPRDEIVDAWGTPLRYAVRNAGPDGTPGTADDFFGDEGEGMPHRRTPYIASAGPDKLWGTWAAPSGGGAPVPDAAAADNLYSFDLK